MSMGGPSALGTLLIQRLDATLGIHTSQQTNLASGARPDAVSQAVKAERAQALHNTLIQHPRRAIELAQPNSSSIRGQSAQSRQENSLGPARPIADISSTASAPTTLGRTARLILALLDRYPGSAPPLQGRQALLSSLSEASPQSMSNRFGLGLKPPLSEATPTTGRGGEPAYGLPAGSAGKPSLQTPLHAAPSRVSAPEPNPVYSRPSQAPAAASLASHFAQALQHTLQHSGLFYESHLEQFIAGRYNQHELKLEPQNRALALTTEPSSPANDGDLRQPDSSALLVRQQLETLGNQTVTWQGQAWPECDMQWEIKRHPEHEPNPSPEAEHWSSQLILQLPKLGEVRIKLQLNQRQLLIDLHTQEHVDYLQRHAPELRQRLNASELVLSQLNIHTPPTEPSEAAS